MIKGKERISIKQEEQLIIAEIDKHDYPFDHVMPEENTRYQQLLYQSVCRGDSKSKSNTPFRCRYVTNKSAFLKIAPLKLEEISLDPYIVLYHEAMYEKEIEVIKNIAKQKVN